MNIKNLKTVQNTPKRVGDNKRVSDSKRAIKHVKDSSGDPFYFQSYDDAESYVYEIYKVYRPNEKRRDGLLTALASLLFDVGLSYSHVVYPDMLPNDVDLGMEYIDGEDQAMDYGFDPEVETYDEWFYRFVEETDPLYYDKKDQFIIVSW